MRPSDELHAAVFVKPCFLYIELPGQIPIGPGLLQFAHEKIHFERGDMLYVRKTEQGGAEMIVVDHIVGYEGRSVSNPWIDESYIKIGSPLELLADAAE